MDNLWEMIAKARGIELDEEFKWKGLRYKVTDYEGLLVLDGSWLRSNSVVSFIIGEGTIEKIPFRPQKDDVYYTYNQIDDKTIICVSTWHNQIIDYTRLIGGIVFRTKEEVEAYLPTWRERISKL